MRYHLLLQSVAFLLFLSLVGNAQESDEKKEPQLDEKSSYTIIVRTPHEGKVAKKIVDTHTAVDEDLRKNFAEHKEKLQDESLTAQQLKELEERLAAISEEVKRLDGKMKEWATAANSYGTSQEPNPEKPKDPDFSEDANPDAYKDTDGNEMDETVSQLLELAAAGICVWQPQYCALAMAIGEMLGLETESIEKKTKTMSSLGQSVNAGELIPGAFQLFKDVLPLAPGELGQLEEKIKDGAKVVSELHKALRTKRDFTRIANKFNIPAKKLNDAAIHLWENRAKKASFLNQYLVETYPSPTKEQKGAVAAVLDSHRKLMSAEERKTLDALKLLWNE